MYDERKTSLVIGDAGKEFENHRAALRRRIEADQQEQSAATRQLTIYHGLGEVGIGLKESDSTNSKSLE